MVTLTDGQRATLFFIARSLAGGTSPTMREIAAAVGTDSTSVINHRVRKLERCGLLTTGPARGARNIRLTPAGRAFVGDVAQTPAERVATAALEAQAAGEPLPARVVAALAAVA